MADLREANQAWEALLTAHSVMMRRFAEEPVWKEHGVSMREYDVLYTLAKCKKPARMSDLQHNVLLSQPALSRMVDRLEARGLLTRVRDDTDGRAVRIALTPRGAEVQRAVGRSHARSVEKAMRVLSPEEQRELGRLTGALHAPDKTVATETATATTAATVTAEARSTAQRAHKDFRK